MLKSERQNGMVSHQFQGLTASNILGIFKPDN